MNKLRVTFRAVAIGCALVAFCAQVSTADDAIVKNTLSRSGGTQGSALDAVAEESLAPAETPAPSKDVSKLEIGEIKSLTISGSVDFAKDEGVQALLERELVDGKVKTVGELQAAIDASLKELYARGLYLAAIYPASSPLNVNVGGSTIGIDLANQAAVAINDHGRQYTVKGNSSYTAIFIDGRLAGGDPRYFSILNSYEGEIARGVVTGPLPVPFVFNVFTAPFYTMDMSIDAPASLGQTYQSEEAGTIDVGDEFPDADTSLSIPGLPKNSTIFFGTSNDEKKDEAKKDGSVAML